jgi:hypothetical protein
MLTVTLCTLACLEASRLTSSTLSNTAHFVSLRVSMCKASLARSLMNLTRSCDLVPAPQVPPSTAPQMCPATKIWGDHQLIAYILASSRFFPSTLLTPFLPFCGYRYTHSFFCDYEQRRYARSSRPHMFSLRRRRTSGSELPTEGGGDMLHCKKLGRLYNECPNIDARSAADCS